MADPKSASPSLEARRKETLAQLESLHGTRAIGAEEYRRRAEVARRAQDETELDSVRPGVEGRGAPPQPTPPAPARQPAQAAHASTELEASDGSTGLVFACMGGSMRKGAWEPPETLYAFALMGGIELDFRDAALLEGTTEVDIFALMGGVKITVPSDVDVEVSGIGFMGGFEHVSHHVPGEKRPLIRVRGLALMGGVSVKVKPPPGQSGMRRLAKRVRDLV